MTISWPVTVIIAIVLTIVLTGIGVLALTAVRGRTEIAREETKGRHAEQYRQLAVGYEALAKEMREAQKAMQADLDEVRKKVEAMERMMREVQ